MTDSNGPSEQMVQYARQYQCPDCNVEVDLVHINGDPSNYWHMEVHHDDTCPTLARLERGGR